MQWRKGELDIFPECIALPFGCQTSNLGFVVDPPNTGVAWINYHAERRWVVDPMDRPDRLLVCCRKMEDW
jgi:hypothetical protein